MEQFEDRSFHEERVPDQKLVNFVSDQEGLLVSARLHDTKEGHETIDQVSYLSQNKLIKRDFYSYVKYASEYYSDNKQENRVIYREFYNEDGSIAYIQHVSGKTETFEFPHKIYYSKNELYLAMIKKLNFKSEDTVIIDRMDDGNVLINGQLLFEHHLPAKLIVVVHADHFDKHYTDQQRILWNNFYEYQFTHAKDVDAFVVSTDTQKKLLIDQLQKYQNVSAKVVTIPVGALPDLKKPQGDRKPGSIITASRLAPEKHLDWLIRAAVEAHQRFPQLTLDIYGEGVQKKKLSEIINECDANEYISLKGQHNLDHIYQKYMLYASASTSEGFGLSLMEAVGSGLPMVGFDVPYGNPTFINNGKNGYLLSYQEEWQDQKKIHQLASGITDVFLSSNWDNLSDYSYHLAENYLSKNVAKRWSKLLEESSHD